MDLSGSGILSVFIQAWEGIATVEEQNSSTIKLGILLESVILWGVKKRYDMTRTDSWCRILSNI